MYTADVLIQGFPGRAVCHGGLGWSTITLLRGQGRVILLDVGAFGVRRELAAQLKARDIAPEHVTDIILTHAHFDHASNFLLFPQARIWIGQDELDWAAAQPPGFNPLPELYVRELAQSPRVTRIRGGAPFLPGIEGIEAPGHTPGHMLYYLPGTPAPLLFTGDAAKNRAELLSMDVDATLDRAASQATLRRIWEWWQKVPGTLLIPGHDLSMRLDAAGKPTYLGARKAAIEVWFGETLTQSAQVDLCAPGAFGAGYGSGE